MTDSERQHQNLFKRGTGSKLADVGRAAVPVVYYWRGRRLRNRLRASVGRLSGKVCGVPGASSVGEKLGVSFVERNKTWEPTRGCPSRRAASAAGGQVRRRPIASGRDGASVEGARSGKPATWRREAAGQQHWDWNARRSLMNIGDLWPTSEVASVRVLDIPSQAASLVNTDRPAERPDAVKAARPVRRLDPGTAGTATPPPGSAAPNVRAGPVQSPVHSPAAGG